MPHLRAIFPKAVAIARGQNPSCRFASIEELDATAKFDLVIAPASFTIYRRKIGIRHFDFASAD